MAPHARIVSVLLAIVVWTESGDVLAQELTDRELSQWTEYIFDLEGRVARRHDDAQLMLRLTSAYVRIGDIRRALPALERLADLGIDTLRITLFRGDVHFNVGEFDAAARAYLDALQRAPGQPHALTQLWRLMLRVTLSGQDVEFDRTAVISTLQNDGLYFPEGYSPTANGPQQASRLVDRASALLMRQRSQEAVVLLTRAIRSDPGNAEAFAALSRAYETENDEQSAVGASLVYLLLAPDAPDAPRVRRLIGQVIERRNLR